MAKPILYSIPPSAKFGRDSYVKNFFSNNITDVILDRHLEQKIISENEVTIHSDRFKMSEIDPVVVSKLASRELPSVDSEISTKSPDEAAQVRIRISDGSGAKMVDIYGTDFLIEVFGAGGNQTFKKKISAEEKSDPSALTLETNYSDNYQKTYKSGRGFSVGDIFNLINDAHFAYVDEYLGGDEAHLDSLSFHEFELVGTHVYTRTEFADDLQIS